MLNRDVCRKCRKKFGWDVNVDIVGIYDVWACPPLNDNARLHFTNADMTLPPPASCPHKFEHGVAEGMTND